MARIRAKLHNRLKTRNLNVSMSLRLILCLLSSLHEVKIREGTRRKVVHQQKERKQYTMESDLDCIMDQFDTDYFECTPNGFGLSRSRRSEAARKYRR